MAAQLDHPRRAGRQPVYGAAAPLRRAADLWWLHPRRLVLFFILPVYASFMFYDFHKVVPIAYIPSWNYAWGAILMLCIVVGVQVALLHVRPTALAEPPQISRKLMLFLLAVTAFAYAYWFGPLVSNPDALLGILMRTRSEVRDDISTTPGLTTLTQFGIAYVIAYAIKTGARVQKVSFIEHVGFVIVLLLAMFRAFAWAERLAVLELLVCFGAARLAYLPIRSETQWRLASIVPMIAPFVLYVLFTASEVNRSWRFYENDYPSVWHFTLDRLQTYYATASNNGIGLLAEMNNWPNYIGAYTFEWLYKMPGIGPMVIKALGDPRNFATDFLEIYARPEFNSPTGIFRAVADFGYFGSAVFFTMIGWLIGRLYHSFRCGRLAGLLLFPIMVIYLMELLRFSYLSEPRVVPILIALGLIALNARSNRGRALVDWAAGSSVRHR
jgi:oligosaccharide repeat unit polymerase